MCAVQVLYLDWRHVIPKDDLTLPFITVGTVGIDINSHIDNNNSISISSTLYYVAECSVAGHVSWRRSPHVTVMSAQPAGCAVYLPPGSPGPDALLNRSQYSMQYSTVQYTPRTVQA